MTASAKKILLVRNDKLGDFMLAYPAFALLKQAMPDAQVHALVQSYTAPMAELCPWIDTIRLDATEGATLTRARQLAALFRQEDYDAIITLYSTTHVGLAAAMAGIPWRLAPATKLAQIFYNQRLKQQRSRSEKPEYVYNRDLVEYYLTDQAIPVPACPSPPYLQLDEKVLATTRENFFSRHGLAENTKPVFIHPGSGGSANNLSISQFARLAHALELPDHWQLIISAGPGEQQYAEELARLTGSLAPVVYHSTQGLPAFTRHLALADLFISGSTGPLHIAGALDVATAAFYTRRRSATPLRWQTLNAEARRLAFTPAEGADLEDMQRIDIPAAAASIRRAFIGT